MPTALVGVDKSGMVRKCAFLWSPSQPTIKWSKMMSQSEPDTHEDKDQVESVIKYAHIVLPCVGAAMIFLMAFIAITVA